MVDYRGPYFRTGVDGSGNYWELESMDIQSQGKRLSRTPSRWELQKPRPGYPSLGEGKNSQELSSSTSSRQDDNSPIPPISRSLEQHLLPMTAASVQQDSSPPPPPLPPNKNDFIISKTHLREMLVEIWNESPNLIPQFPKSTKSLELKNSKEKAGEVMNLKDNEEALMEGKEATSIPLNPTLSKHRVTAREEKLRIFECFRMMSDDPPKTPPPQELECEVSKISLEPIKRKNKRSKSKKSKTTALLIVPKSSSPGLIPHYDTIVQKYLGEGATSNFGSSPLQNKKGPPSEVREKPSKKPNTTRSMTNRDDSINSTMTVKKIPLVNGFFNDEMLPPIVLSSVPAKKKVTKKRFDAFVPLGMPNALTPPYQPQQQEYLRYVPEEVQSLRRVKLKKPHPQATTMQMDVSSTTEKQTPKKSLPTQTQPVISRHLKLEDIYGQLPNIASEFTTFFTDRKRTSK